MIAATPKNIEWLFEKLYEAKLEIMFSEPQVSNPVFVLLTKTQDERHRVERQFYDYVVARYGVSVLHMKVSPSTCTKTLTRLELPEIGASVLLMDVG